MRLITYGSCFILCCILLSLTEAQHKRIQNSKDVDNGSEERYTKYKKEENRKGYKYKKDDSNEREIYETKKYKQNCRGKSCDRGNTKDSDDESDVTNHKYLKYTRKFNKYTDASDEDSSYKKRRDTFNNINNKGKYKEANGGNYEFKKKLKKMNIKVESDEDSEEVVVPRKQDKKQNGNNNEKKQSRSVSKRDEDHSNVSQGKVKRNKKTARDTIDDSEENIKEEPIRVRKNIKSSKMPVNDDSEEETPKTGTKRRLIISSDDDADEETTEDNDSNSSEETDENNETEEVSTGTCIKKSKCPEKISVSDENSDENSEIDNKPVNRQKIKYSVKFAHEKQKNLPNEDDNIMKKIHREKKYKYDNDDDDDDSSEEHEHPKRIHYIDEDEE